MSKALSMKLYLLLFSAFFLYPLLPTKPKVLVRRATRAEVHQAILTAGTQEGSRTKSNESSQLTIANMDIDAPFKSSDENPDPENDKLTTGQVIATIICIVILIWCGILIIFVCPVLVYALLAGFYYGFTYLYKKFKNRNNAGDAGADEITDGAASLYS